ncbi:hypothetical protein D0436_11230 [Shewanella decolorationis]|uniref:Uncharacterized protein n=1 Tax=Shewanella decolorationis TaxID=256839 RepID=A0A5B8QWB4_9GAMM|nr:hypothetical protein [Shewanella decolorationis]QDZ90990.1 hypothetical protein D0436_11230 [Shewanella decolorationis]
MRHELYLLQQDNRLSCQLARELVSLIETVPYQQTTIELKLLELLACTQQKNRSLLMLMQLCESTAVEEQRIRQFKFSHCLNQHVNDWQQRREMNKLGQHFLPLLRHYLQEIQALELQFYQQLSLQNEQTTSGGQGHSQRAQNPT